MENGITIFKSEQFGEIRTAEDSVKDTYLGFVYACEYGDYIKIGSTKQPYTRLGTFIREAQNYGNSEIGRFAMSGAHTNYRENEKSIHFALSKFRKKGTELFNITFDDAIQSIVALELRDDTELIKINSKIFLKGMQNFVTGKTPTISFHPKDNDIVLISDVHGYIDDGNNIWLNAEDVAVGFGFTQEKKGAKYVRWETINKYLLDFGFSQPVGKGSYIPESMVYRLGFKANNQVAVKFQTVLAEEVLPSIRKHGMYATTQTIENLLSDPDNAIKLLQTLKEERQQRQLAESKAQLLEEVTKEQAPKVVFADAIVGSQSSCLIGELAKIITQNGYKIGQNNLFEWMRKNHYLGKHGEYYNIPNQRYIEQGLFELKKSTHSENGVMKTTVTPKVTGKGQQYFVNLFLKRDNSLYANKEFNA